jgi:hypothetical protein
MRQELPMPRHAQLKKKDGYWFTKAGAPNGKYFGRVDEISAADAKVLFVDYLKTVVTPESTPQTANVVVPTRNACRGALGPCIPICRRCTRQGRRVPGLP